MNDATSTSGCGCGARRLVPGLPGGVDPDGSPVSDVVGWRRAGRPRTLRPMGPLAGATTLAGSGLALGRPRPGSTGSALSTPLSLFKTIAYRAVQVEVPRDWYEQWREDWESLEGSDEGAGTVTSVADLLSALWPELTAAVAARTRLDDDTLDAVLGCYDLQSTAHRALFWRTGWGPPRQAWRTMCRLVAAYADDIEDRFMAPVTYPMPGTDLELSWCEGFGDFCRDVVRGRAAATRLDTAHCQVAVHFCANDERFQDAAYHARCTSHVGRGCGWAFAADDAGRCFGRWFDAEMDAWEAEETSWSERYRVFQNGEGVAEFPDDFCDDFGSGGQYQVDLHPIALSWVGFLADRILHLARIVYDYARYSRDRFVFDAARQLAAYALCPMVRLGRTLIHELGHTYMGWTGHCPYHGCFDVASMNWEVALRGRLGLPPDLLHSGAVDSSSARAAALLTDFGGGAHEQGTTSDPEVREDGSCGSTQVWYEYRWSLDTVGRPGGGATFCVLRAGEEDTATRTVTSWWDVNSGVAGCTRVLP